MNFKAKHTLYCWSHKCNKALKCNKTIECFQNRIYSKERRRQFKWEINKRSFEKHNILLRSIERAPPSNDLRTLKSKINNVLLHWTERGPPSSKCLPPCSTGAPFRFNAAVARLYFFIVLAIHCFFSFSLCEDFKWNEEWNEESRMTGQQTCPLTIHFNMWTVSSDVSILRDTVQICERILSPSMVFAHRCSMLSEKREREVEKECSLCYLAIFWFPIPFFCSFKTVLM